MPPRTRSASKLSNIITLLTDFGTRDTYVGAMKGVVLGISPTVRIVDLTHDVPKFNVRYAAFLLRSSTPHFPRGTIHVVVVDPGVGSPRKAVIVETRRSFLVGPDNGVLSPAARLEEVKRVVEIEDEKYMLPQRSKTFHGRDVFAPAAAHLARGVPLDEFGHFLHRIVELRSPEPQIRDDEIVCEVLHIDGFGNIITNIDPIFLSKTGMKSGSMIRVKSALRAFRMQLCRTYSDVEKRKMLALIGSHGLLEIAANQGDAAKSLRTRIGRRLKVRIID
ncbi:MAG: S-adenosyl-l-methionine hydroxide adenosyltransferase family protein [Nitrososphaeria archaeon]